jgi:ABC-2 type transport system ATP-binding protein
VGIIEQGQLKFLGTVDEIMQQARVGTVLHVGVRDRLSAAADTLKAMPAIEEVTIVNNHLRVVIGVANIDPSLIAQKLVTDGFGLTRLEEEKVNLETAFMRLTKGLVQ